MKKNFYFYLFECKDGSLYSGSTQDLKKRVAQHNSGKGSKYVWAHGGGRLAYFEKFETWSKALSREAKVKKLTRNEKLLLIKK